MVAVVESSENELPSGTLVLGRYTAVGKLAQGGMAEVYLCRQLGPAGYQKLVVIKRVRPHLANDADFVGMFVNEARLAAMINHPNVVQIFDLGDEPRPAAQGGGQDWFLAMEYLDGRDMLQVGRACRAHNKAVPFDVTARIIADACAGLDHAHGLKSPDGKSLNLVHRDMSPENILITFEGQVKVVDFGIAKASDNLIKTQAGQIKGKLGYVAPEAILGKPVDARADVFAIGATLYLFLSGRPAFSGSNPMEIFERSLKPPTPPREVNPRVPEALDQICMKALHQDRDKRYRSAGEVRVALDAYLQSTGRPLGPVQLSQFMRILFPPDKDPTRQRIDKLLADAPVVDAKRSASLPPTMAPTAAPVAAPAPLPVDVEPAYIDDDKTNIVASHEDGHASIPDPITLQTSRAELKPAAAGPAHLRSMSVEDMASNPGGRPAGYGDMTHEDMRRTVGPTDDDAPTINATMPEAAAAQIDIDDADDLDLAAALAESDDLDDLDMDVDLEISSPGAPAPVRQATLTGVEAADAFAGAVVGDDDDMGPPPPFEPSGAVSRPLQSPPVTVPPPAFDAAEAAPSAPPAYVEPAPVAPPAFSPASDPSPSPSAAPVGIEASPSLAPQFADPAFNELMLPPPAKHPLGVRLAMFGFGVLSGTILLLVVAWITGIWARFVG